MSRRSHLAFSVILLLAASASASTMAFALRLQLAASGERLHFVALPYQYVPATAEALCTDLGGSATVAEVLRWDEGTSRFVVHPCGTGLENFALAEGLAYGVRTAIGQAVDALIVGIHDPAFTYSLTPGPGSNLTWVSVPYHAALLDLGGVDGEIDAEDLCREVGEGLFAVVRWDEAASVYEAHVCGSVFGQPFLLDIGQGYGLVNADGQTVEWLPAHY